MKVAYASQPTWHNNFNNSQLANVQLPAKLKCNLCPGGPKWKAQPNFSNKQLSEAKMVVLRKGQQALADHEMGCIICLSGHQREELTCIDCHKTMGLDAFAKTHRKDRENAKCMKCMEKRLAIKTTRQYEEEFNIAEDDVDSDDEATDYRSSFDESSSTTGNSSVSDYSTNYGSSSMNSSGMSGGVQVADEMAFHDFMSADSKDLANRARSSAAPSSNDSTYGSGMRSSQQNSQLRSNSAPHSPFNGFGGGPVAKLAPSVASTETGSRARFPKVHASNQPQASTEASDSDSDGGSGSDSDSDNELKSATHYDDAPYDSDEDGDNFFG